MVKVVMGVQFSLLALFRVEYSCSGGERAKGWNKTNAPRGVTSKNKLTKRREASAHFALVHKVFAKAHVLRMLYDPTSSLPLADGLRS